MKRKIASENRIAMAERIRKEVAVFVYFIDVIGDLRELRVWPNLNLMFSQSSVYVQVKR